MTISKDDIKTYRYKSEQHDNERELKWNGKRVLHSDLNPYSDPGIDFSDDPSKTDASQAEECDVNRIVQRFAKTGVLPGTDVARVYSDVSDPVTYQEALNIVINAEEQFSALDAQTRGRFHNDPSEFMDFVHNPENASEMVKLGLATARKETPVTTQPEASIAPSQASPAPAAGSRAARIARQAEQGEDT